MFRKVTLLGAVALGLWGGAASAQEAPLKRFYLHAGPGGVILNEGAVLSAGGAVIPGATVTANDSVTPVVEIGYFLNRNFAVSFTGGYPPTATVQAAGTLAGAGTVGKAVYGPMALTAHYHLTNFGRIRPYIGGGVVFMYVFSTTDGLLTNLKVHNHFGYTGQAGVDVDLSDRWGAFFDVKAAHLHTTSTGNLGPTLITGDVKMDPTVIHGGVSYRF